MQRQDQQKQQTPQDNEVSINRAYLDELSRQLSDREELLGQIERLMRRVHAFQVELAEVEAERDVLRAERDEARAALEQLNSRDSTDALLMYIAVTTTHRVTTTVTETVDPTADASMIDAAPTPLNGGTAWPFWNQPVPSSTPGIPDLDSVGRRPGFSSNNS